MNIGDLVKVKDIDYSPTVGLFEYNIKAGKYDGWVGMIIEVGVYAGRKDVKVMWQDGSIQTDKSRRLEVISA